MTIVFRVFGIPQTKGSTRAFYVKALGRSVITNDNPRNKAWAQLVSEVAAQHRPPGLFLGPVRMDAIFHLPKPKSLPKRRVSWPTKKPDISKLTRSAEDAMTGIIFRDDAQIVESKQEKIYSDSPGVEITVTEIGDDGGLLL